MSEVDDLEPVNVYQAQNPLEAEFLRNLLAESGIETCVVGEAMSQLLGVSPGAALPYLAVRKADEGRAREILREYEQKHRQHNPDDSPPATTWKCTACGEMVDDEFDLCWNCQNPRVPY